MSDHCVTCSDEGVPMRVVAVDSRQSTALCAAEDGSESTVQIELVEPVAEGDAVLVHAGTALVRL